MRATATLSEVADLFFLSDDEALRLVSDGPLDGWEVFYGNRKEIEVPYDSLIRYLSACTEPVCLRSTRWIEPEDRKRLGFA